MKRSSNSRNFDPSRYESFDVTDTRYYGVFLKGVSENRHILIDPIRYDKQFHIREEMKEIMAKRIGPLFKPAKRSHLDYNVNCMLGDILNIQQQWEKTNKPLISRVLSEICGKTYTPDFSDDLAASGILEPDEVVFSATMQTNISHLMAEAERNTLYYSLYAEFFQQMASQIEALFVKALTRNGYEGDTFNRNVLYAFKGSNQEKVSQLDGFLEYDKMYAIWNFIKHNSLSTFNTLKNNFPDVIKEGEYSQGELACFHVNFNDNLIDTILSGVSNFIKAYCRLVFNEDDKEALWNSDDHFLGVVHSEIEAIENPMGIPWWL